MFANHTITGFQISTRTATGAAPRNQTLHRPGHILPGLSPADQALAQAPAAVKGQPAVSFSLALKPLAQTKAGVGLRAARIPGPRCPVLRHPGSAELPRPAAEHRRRHPGLAFAPRPCTRVLTLVCLSPLPLKSSMTPPFAQGFEE